ncbi:copper resistance protein CopC [Paenibacillus sp. p3-SID1389]
MFTFVSPTITSAHTKLTSSSPMQDEVVNTAIGKIRLEFNTTLSPGTAI